MAIRRVRIREKINIPLETAYRIAADVARYPHFVPGVSKVAFLSDEGDQKMIRVSFRKWPFLEALTSRVTFDRNRSILIEPVARPFKGVSMQWTFEPAEESVWVSFKGEFNLPSALLRRLIGEVVVNYAEEILEAFLSRARQVYARHI